jgi:radical SAM protein with 4Fe4S-binding SPASM domain
MKRYERDSFCYMPWHAIDVRPNGEVKPCCQYLDSINHTSNGLDLAASYDNTHMRNLRQEFLDGKRPSNCKSCWEREAQVGESRRTWFETFLGEHLPTDHQYMANVDDPKWIYAEINLSNVCNLKCRMCGSWGSNQWFEEELRLANIDPRFEKNPKIIPLVQHDLDRLKSLLPHVSEIKRIDFKGGEPMLAKHHNQFLDWLIEQGHNDRIILSYTTNGTVINQQILERFTRFKQVKLCFSIEATGSLYSYIRGGSHTLEQTLKNIRTYDDLENVHISFCSTVQAYNLLNLSQLHALLNGLNLKHGGAKGAFGNLCNRPAYLAPFVVPDDIRDQALMLIRDIPDFERLTKTLETRTFDQNAFDTFCQFTRYLDSWRCENICDHVPQLARYFQD